MVVVFLLVCEVVVLLCKRFVCISLRVLRVYNFGFAEWSEKGKARRIYVRATLLVCLINSAW